MRQVYLILALLLFIIKASAFDILNISTITDRNGLSQNTIRCMMQDSYGFMWMGTINGLNRYNGKEFTVVHPELPGSLLLPDSRIRSITEDKNGYIWIRTFSNTLFCYDPKLESMIDYDPQNKLKIFTQIAVLPSGDVWMWGDKGCCRVRYVNGKMETWKPDHEKLFEQPILCVFEDSNRRVWIGSREELFMVDGDVVHSMLKGTTVFNVYEADNLYFIGGNSIIIFDNKRSSFLPAIYYAKDRASTHARSCMLMKGF